MEIAGRVVQKIFNKSPATISGNKSYSENKQSHAGASF
ncbi:hypothetical protein CEV33_0070 [Brucella grignonensis]|uniref:Uncharacterized protein n=1 Tax=Brucella grignonensis TaxID=94627 RepID=A0A256FNN5_9HYPH|nr:hypothetical protein CEV33_0070 [Brucella grignonensis]